MRTVNVGLIGFGTVGKGVVKTLLSKKKMLEERTGLSVKLVKIADKDLRARENVRVPRKLLTKNVDSVIKDRSIDIIVELIGGIRPAKDIILKALSLGKHVVTANKALLAEYGKELFTAASRFRANLGFEASVGGGIPVIAALKNSLVSNNIERIRGILNGTSNFILSRMSEECCDFNQALNDAKEKGIAERNPKLDISGEDSSHKLAILALLGFGLSVKPKDIYTEGIEDIDPIDEAEVFATLKDMGTKVSAIARLVGKERTYVSHSMRLLKLHPKVRAAVRQLAIPREHALALLRLESEQQISLMEEIMEKNLTMVETRDRVRELLGKELKWKLVPIRIEPAIYNRLAQIAPEGDVSKLLKQAVEKLASEIKSSTTARSSV